MSLFIFIVIFSFKKDGYLRCHLFHQIQSVGQLNFGAFDFCVTLNYGLASPI